MLKIYLKKIERKIFPFPFPGLKKEKRWSYLRTWPSNDFETEVKVQIDLSPLNNPKKYL